MFAIRYYNRYITSTGEISDSPPPRLHLIAADSIAVVGGKDSMFKMQALLGQIPRQEGDSPYYHLNLGKYTLGIYWDGTDYVPSLHEKGDPIFTQLMEQYGEPQVIRPEIIGECFRSAKKNIREINPFEKKHGWSLESIQRTMFVVMVMGLVSMAGGYTAKTLFSYQMSSNEKEKAAFVRQYNHLLTIKAGNVIKSMNRDVTLQIMAAVRAGGTAVLTSYEVDGETVSVNFENTKGVSIGNFQKIGKITRVGEVVSVILR